MKRHYAKGFYVENGKRKMHDADPVRTEIKNNSVEKMQPAMVSFSGREHFFKELELSVNATTKSVQKTEKKNSFQSQLKKHDPKSAGNEIAVKKVSVKSPPVFLEKTKEKSVKGSGDTDLIIMVILCFFPFINLIAMYLHDGKKITMNFWIDLILDVLFFFPGIIFALLVVLGVFSLA